MLIHVFVYLQFSFTETTLLWHKNNVIFFPKSSLLVFPGKHKTLSAYKNIWYCSIKLGWYLSILLHGLILVHFTSRSDTCPFYILHHSLTLVHFTSRSAYKSGTLQTNSQTNELMNRQVSVTIAQTFTNK